MKEEQQSPPPAVVWRIVDGKRGHENQTLGLLEALDRIRGVKEHALPVSHRRASWVDAVRRRFPRAADLPHPDLILAAGHQTHASVLAAGRATGAPTILLMAPPRGLTRLFHVCVIPGHDGRTGPNILTTRGALNRIHPSGKQQEDRGLILVGGPSRHHGWDTADLLRQVNTILRATPDVRWSLTTSRRTPPETLEALANLPEPNLHLVPAAGADPDWLPRHLEKAGQVRVSEDSVSMVYEALSAGGRVGLLSVPRRKRRPKIVRGLDPLRSSGHLHPAPPAQPDLRHYPTKEPLREADRIARILLERFLS